MTLALVLSACGGGGDDNGPPPPPPGPGVLLPANATATASTNAAAPTSTVNVTFTNAPTTFYLNASTFTTNGIESVENNYTAATQGSFHVNYKAPSGLAPAAYADTVTVRMCGDQACAQILATATLPVTYTVTAPAGGNVPAATLDTANYSHAALSVDQSPTIIALTNAFTFTNFAVTPVVRVEPVGANLPVTATYAQTDATHGSISLTFRAPAQMTPGIANAQINFRVCLDANCTNPINPATYALNVTYEVAGKVTVPNSGGTTIATHTLAAYWIDANPSSDFVYATVPTTNSLVALNTSTGATQPFAVPAGQRPSRVALSEDGQNLFTSTHGYLHRFSTTNFGLTATIPVNNVPDMLSIATMPGNTLSFAVSSHRFLAIYDDTTMRPNTGSLYDSDTIEELQWFSPTLLFSTHYFPGGPAWTCPFPVDANGVGAEGTCGPDSTGYASLGGTLVYENGTTGAIRNPADWSQVGTLPVTNGTIRRVLLDPVGGSRLYAYVSNGANGCAINTYDANTRALIATLRLPTVNPGVGDGTCRYTARLVRYGTNGLAIASQWAGPLLTYIVVIDGAFVAP